MEDQKQYRSGIDMPLQADDSMSNVDGDKINHQRRNFSRLGLSAPVILTLSSRPVVAENCYSVLLSGNLSPNGPQFQQGACVPGRSASELLADGSLSSIMVKNADDIGGPFSGDPYYKYTVAQILGNQDGTYDPYGIYLTAYLNVLYTPMYIIQTMSQLEEILLGSYPIGFASKEAFLLSTFT